MAKKWLLLSVFAVLIASVQVQAQSRGTPEFEQWVDQHQAKSLRSVLGNVSPDGTTPGCVVAAQSKTGAAPYWYHWVRDAALVMDALLGEYETTQDPQLSALLEQRLWEYVGFSTAIQKVQTRSATGTDPMGLGEPKYEVNAKAFKGDWGRPQLDGPGLRISSMVRFAGAYLNKGGDIERVRNSIYRAELPARTPAKIDLEMLSYNILLDNFDLWEEVRATHFYTSMVQRRGLLDGADLAAFMKDQGAADFYRDRASKLNDPIAKHWDERRQYIGATLNRTDGLDYKYSNLDVSVVLGALHSYGEKDNFWAPDNGQVLATALALRKTHREAFSINLRVRPDLPPGIGRYTEDRYFGGNPWFLTTIALAELNYRVLSRAVSRGSLVIPSVAVEFFKHIADGKAADAVPAEGGAIDRNDPRFAAIARALAFDADGFLERARVHMGPGGAMDEQFDRNTGFMTGASELTWSYASFVTAAAARRAAKAAFPDAFGA